jgi:hypothetical protein
MKRLFAAISLVAIVNGALAAGEPAAKPSGKEILALIDRLVTPNKGADRDAEARAFEAWLTLHKMGMPAFPYLHARRNDKRYSMTLDTGSTETAFTVGELCMSIIDGNLNPLRRTAPDDEESDSLRNRPLYNAYANFDAWWETHRQLSLREIQIESLEAIIAEEEKSPKDYSIAERNFLKAQLAALRKSNKPLPGAVPFAR